MKRHLEYVGENNANQSGIASKFWEAWVQDDSLFTRFGKIGASSGQTTVKTFASSEEAEKALDKAVKEKLRKGYVEVSPRTHLDGDAEKMPDAPNAPREPETLAALAAYMSWEKSYRPKYWVDMPLESQPKGWDEKFVWTFSDNFENGEFVFPGFESYSEASQMPVQGYFLTEVPFSGEEVEYIDLSVPQDCSVCLGEGFVDEEPCAGCDGDGYLLIELYAEPGTVLHDIIGIDDASHLPKSWPNPTKSETDGDSSPQAKQARFCSQCGNRFTEDSQRFCVQCGAERAGH